MSKRYKLQEKTALAVPEAIVSLPFDRPVAVYYRQSTEAQVGNISTTIQTVDMVADLQRRGWPEDKIILIDMDKGISGTTKIDEREGMSNLFALITEGKIGAVACQDEDRLFRDVTQIQVNIFIEACKTSRVLVLTSSMIYDFANELTGSFCMRQFRFKSEMAAEYINAVIKGKLQKAKRHLLLEGRWAGAGIPPGFMVDTRKTLPDGSKNEHWRRYAPFELYAEVVREYFRLFLEFGGQLRTTVRHIQEQGPWYPDPTTCKPPDGFRVVYRMARHTKGYCPGRVGLAQLLTNAAYIGHWALNGTIVQWDNHPSIVPANMFMQAYNYLSSVGLDGKPNPEYRSIRENVRPSLETDRPEERPLCAGMVVTKYNDEWRNVGTRWQSTLKHYTYEFRGASNTTNEYVWGRVAEYFDNAVVQLLHDKFIATFDSPVWEESLASFKGNLEVERKRKQAQLDTLERTMENQIASLDVLTNNNMVKAVQERYEQAKSERDRLTKEILALQDEARQFEAIKELRLSCGPALENWPSLSRDAKRVIILSFIHRIEVVQEEKYALRVVVRWRDESEDSLVLSSPNSGSTVWLEREKEKLRNLVEQGIPALEIAAEFSTRTWSALSQRISLLGLKGRVRIPYKTIHGNETYCEYIARVEEKCLAHCDSVTHCWMSCPSSRRKRWKCCANPSKIKSSPSPAPKAR